MTALILKSNTWHLIEKLPEEPRSIRGDIGNLCYRSLRRDYDYILQRAIDNAVRVENQEMAEQIAKKEIDTLMLSHAMPDEVYPVEVSYDIDYFDPLGERLARLLLQRGRAKLAEIEQKRAYLTHVLT